MLIAINVRIMLMAALLTALLLMGCASSRHDYQLAKRQDTVDAYKTFLKKHPNAKQADRAKRRVADLEVERDWRVAESTHTIAGYQNYIANHAQTKNCELAKKRLKELQAEEAWQKAEQQDTIGDYKNYLATYPDSQKSQMAMARIEELTAKRDWAAAQTLNSIQAYQGYLKNHPASRYGKEASQRLKPLIAERDWRAAMAQNSENGWVNYIVNHPDTPKTKDAIKSLRRHKMAKSGSVISWARLGGKTWSQPLEDGFSNYAGSRFKSVTISRQKLLTYFCRSTTELEFPHWVLLNNIKVTGHLKACPDGFRIVDGLALIPIKK